MTTAKTYSAFMAALRAFYCRPVRPTFAESYRYAWREAHLQGWDCPSISTARRLSGGAA